MSALCKSGLMHRSKMSCLFDHVVSAGDASAILRLIRSLHFAASPHRIFSSGASGDLRRRKSVAVAFDGYSRHPPPVSSASSKHPRIRASASSRDTTAEGQIKSCTIRRGQAQAPGLRLLQWPRSEMPPQAINPNHVVWAEEPCFI
jgi:hypothetical protein